jgi:hypothetical protein
MSNNAIDTLLKGHLYPVTRKFENSSKIVAIKLGDLARK